MRFQLIRNATMVWDYAGQHILADPYFAPQFSMPSYSGRSPSPLTPLPFSTESILEGVDHLVLSHLHSDHFDKEAQRLIPLAMPIFCQPSDVPTLQERGFTRLTSIEASVNWAGGTITRVMGHHGLGSVEEAMGIVAGYIFQSSGDPTVYWVGDSVLCDEVRSAIEHYRPDVIITHSGGALWPDGAGQPTLIVMDAEQTLATSRLAPWAKVVAIHLDSVDHATVSRADLHTAVTAAGLGAHIVIPEDGETLLFSA